MRSNAGTVLWSGVGTAGSYSGFAGGAFGAQSDTGDCSQVPNTTNSDYAIAYDTVSGRWSNKVPLDSDCASLCGCGRLRGPRDLRSRRLSREPAASPYHNGRVSWR